MYAVPGELASAFFSFFLFGPFHVIAASQILINYSRSEIDAVFFPLPSCLSRHPLTVSNYNIYHKHYYVMGTQFKMAFS